MHTHYDNLKVIPSAPPEVIKAAYRALSQRYHPDRHPGPEAERVMRLLNEAYAVLGDPQRRAVYDRELAAAGRERADRCDASAEARPAAPAGPRGASGNAGSAAGRFFAAAAASAHSLRTPVGPALGICVSRCFARLFDVGWEAGAIGVAAALPLCRHWPGFAAWIDEPGNPLLFAMLCVPAAMLLDASLYGLAGNTPGKALLGLRVTTLDGGRLSWRAYLRRDLAVWARGLGCGIPFVNLVTMWRRGREASIGADVAYDMKTGHQVSAAHIGVVRKLAFGLLSLGLVAGVVGAPAIDTLTDRGPSVEQPRPSVAVAARGRTVTNVSVRSSRASPWTNPLTGNSAMVDGIWHMSSIGVAGRGTVYSFTARDGRTTVLFAAQDAPRLSMGEYVLAYLRGTASAMNLSPPDSVDHDDGVDRWSADGHLNAKPAVAIHVELRHLGESFWRVVVMRSARVRPGDAAIGRLVRRLWATVPDV